MTTETETHPRLIALNAENFKRLTAVSIDIGGGVTRITGKNGNGKTSVLDAITAAIGGKDLVPASALRKGAKKGHAQVVIEGVQVGEHIMNLTVTRSFREGADSELKITTPEGVKVGSPQAVLDGLMAKIGFDPLAFTRQKPKEQAAILQKLAGLDFTKVDGMRAKFYADRTNVNRDLARAKAKLETMPTHDDAPAEEVSAAELVDAVQALRGRQAERQKAVRRATELSGDIQALETRLGEMRREWDEANAIVSGLAEVSDDEITEATEKLNSLESINRKVRENAAHAATEAEAEQFEKAAATLTANIEKIDTGKATRIAEAKLPVDGLGFDDDGVTFNGVAFTEASAAEQLRISVAVGLALNPSLKLMLVRDASLLDSDSLAMLEQMAEQHEAQVIIEQVTDGEQVGICIVDGRVASVNTEE